MAIFAQLEHETAERDNMPYRACEGIWNGGPVNYGFKASKITILNKSKKEKQVTVLEPIK
ncbi:hypothetical protein [Pelotomaculum propionicicum]|uniref:hypothetical protein n=1 Tax=Pelotomaculum propionicicum TaxID=258475 RepID=UPI00129108CB|nr:hypothetical protein [Pelotomaculum propionicicum]NLI12738.1 hypothetical protein [Peptococcaceae bacterium]